MRGDLLHFRGTVDPTTAAPVLEAVWEHLASRGIHQSDPSTWPSGPVHHLQSLKRSGRLRALTTDNLLDIQSGLLERPTSVESIPLVTFPDGRVSWRVPHTNWHMDEPGRGDPVGHRTGRFFVLLSDLGAQNGATLAVEGSAALVRRIIAESPDQDAESSTDVRRMLQRKYGWFKLLMSERDPPMDAGLLDGEEIDGVFCRVRELTGSAGDVWCMDQWTLHNASTNTGNAPRIAVTLFASE